jgi:DNA-binding MarR family transcriptional regulator
MGQSQQDQPLGDVLEFMRVIWALDHGLQRMSKRLEGELGVTGPQRLVLRIVGRMPGISAGDLSRVLHVHPSTLTGVLQRLEGRGLLLRKPDPADGRRALLRLSPRGRRLGVSQEGTVEAVVRRVLGKTAASSADATREVLAHLASQLEKELAR